MIEELQEIEKTASEEIAQADDSTVLKELRIRYLGRKGEITSVLRSMGQQPPEDRPILGQKANELKEKIENLLQEREKALKDKDREAAWEKDRIDVTLPGRPFRLGHLHPITLITEEIKEIFGGLGFRVAEGPEIEKDYYNFEALNMPPDHPARDMQDSFYFTSEILLRTHTSPVQIRVMEKEAPQLPVRIIAPGKVYRRDDDATHSPMFFQVEGLAVDHGITFADLKGVLLHFAREMFGEDQKIRLRPSFFPFTEPSAEVDIYCVMCKGEGCRVCSHTGWLEILGAGMVHPRVLEISGYSPDEVTGFAFGMGIDRVAMLKYGINDIRLFYTNDHRMLKQF